MDKILFVDDEPNILNAFKRRLSNSYEFITSTSATEAVQILQTKSPISIVISDMHMPGMQGTEFLKEVAKKSPDSIRVMLTGLADQRTAVRAINEGSVFRFINKPCSIDEFEKVLNDCIAQRKMQQQEKDLLQNTLGGVLSLITDLLSFIDSDGVQSATKSRKVLREIAKVTPLPLIELELAALLKGLGKLSLPLELLLKNAQGESLSSLENDLVNKSQQTSARLIRQIPRLEKVSAYIELGCGISKPKNSIESNALLSLNLANKIAIAENDGEAIATTIARISQSLSVEEMKLASLLLGGETTNNTVAKPNEFIISLSELTPGQRLLDDIKDKNGKLLLKKGFIISPAVIERIRNHSELVGLGSNIVVNERTPTRNS